jgi:hypothetical protein
VIGENTSVSHVAKFLVGNAEVDDPLLGNSSGSVDGYEEEEHEIQCWEEHEVIVTCEEVSSFVEPFKVTVNCSAGARGGRWLVGCPVYDSSAAYISLSQNPENACGEATILPGNTECTCEANYHSLLQAATEGGKVVYDAGYATYRSEWRNYMQYDTFMVTDSRLDYINPVVIVKEVPRNPNVDIPPYLISLFAVIGVMCCFMILLLLFCCNRKRAVTWQDLNDKESLYREQVDAVDLSEAYLDMDMVGIDSSTMHHLVLCMQCEYILDCA